MSGNDKELIAIDLFAGAGGLTVGLKQAGFKVKGAVEVDPLAVETYRKNHRNVKVWDKDIRLISGREILRELGLRKGQLDLLAGCPPCQGFSSMRTLNGKRRVNDQRNDLIFEYLRLVRELKPKAIMMENVPALIKDRRMKRFTEELKTLGFTSDPSPVVLNAADYAVPQRRRRMILLSTRIGQITMPEKSESRKTVRDAIGKLPKPGASGDVLHDAKANRSERIEKMIRKIPLDGGSRTDLPKRLRLKCHTKDCDGFKDVYGRMAWGDVSPTITGGCINPSKGRFLHPSQHRAITLREAALLQGFPHKYRFSLKRGRFAVALMIGNALPPAFIKVHALAIKKSLQTVDRSA